MTGWILAGAGAWMVIGLGAALALGRMIRIADEQQAEARPDLHIVRDHDRGAA